MAFNISNLLVNNKSNKTPLIVVFIIITFFTVFTSWYLLSGDDDDKNNKSNKNDDGDDNTTPESESKQDNTDLTNTCDASVAPTNGGVGDCTSTLASGKTCTPTCDAGYTLSGQTSCSAGTLSPASCEPKSCNAKITQPVSDNTDPDSDEGKMYYNWSGYGDCTHDLPSGEGCTQTCPSGYTMPGKSTCLNGEMTFVKCKPSSCTIDQNDWYNREGIDRDSCGTELDHGETCTAKGLDGYTR